MFLGTGLFINVIEDKVVCAKIAMPTTSFESNCFPVKRINY